MQALAEVQDTVDKVPELSVAGSGVAWICQDVPSQRSASGTATTALV